MTELDKLLEESLKFNTHLLPVDTRLDTCHLVHGTSATTLLQAHDSGLRPRGAHGLATNWEEHPSNDTVVYLTSAYGLHYAGAACESMGYDLGAIVEVSSSALERSGFVGDEDSYALARVEGLEWLATKSLEERVAYWRSHLEDTDAEASLSVLGNCAYKGTIPPLAIKGVRLLTSIERRRLTAGVSDPSISPANFKILGGMNQQLTAWLMGDEPPLTEWFNRFGPLNYPVMSLAEAVELAIKDL